MSAVHRLAAAVVVGGTLLLPAVASAHGAGEDEQIVLSGRLTVDDGEEFGAAVILDGPVIVDGEIHGDVIAFNGSVVIEGLVEGDVQAFNGPVVVGASAVVHGDIQHRGELTIEPGGDVRGETSSLGAGAAYRRFDLLLRLGAWLAGSVSVLLLGLLLLWLTPRGLDAMRRAFEDRPGAVVGLGAALVVGLPIASILVLLTVVGIPLGVSALLSLGFVYVAGYTIAAWLLGRRVVAPPRSPVVSFLAGWGILRAVSLIPFVAGLSWVAAAAVGLGAAGLAMFRARER